MGELRSPKHPTPPFVENQIIAKKQPGAYPGGEFLAYYQFDTDLLLAMMRVPLAG